MISPTAWSIDGQIKTDVNPVSFSVLGRNTSGWYCDQMSTLWLRLRPDFQIMWCAEDLQHFRSFCFWAIYLNHHLLSFLEPTSQSVELQWVSQADDDWSVYSEYFNSQFHIAHHSKQLINHMTCITHLWFVMFTVLLICTFRWGSGSRPQLWLECPCRTLGKLRRGCCDASASIEGTASS